jgi:hypothetical protein
MLIDYQGQKYDVPDGASLAEIDELINRGSSPVKKQSVDSMSTRNPAQEKRSFWQRMAEASPEGRKAPENFYKSPQAGWSADALSFALPMGAASKLIPNAGKIAKYLADFGGAIGQNAALVGGLNTLAGDANSTAGEKFKEGAATGAGVTTVAHPLISALASSNPAFRFGSGAALAGAGAMMGDFGTIPEIGASLAGGYAALRGKKGFNDLAAKNILGDLTEQDVEKAIAKKSAGEKVGVQLNALEAIDNPIAGKQLAGLGDTPASSKIMYDAGMNRQDSERAAINDLFESISPKGTKQNLEMPAYEKAYKDSVPESALGKLILSDPRLKITFDKVIKDPDFQKDMQGVAPNSIKYIDRAKQLLDDEYNKAIAAGENKKASLIKDSNKKLKDLADSYSPEYKNARQISQKRIVRENIESKLNEADKTGSNFYDKVLKDDKEYKDLYRALSNPENHGETTIAQEKLKAMRDSFGSLVDSTTGKTAATLAKSEVISNPGLVKSVSNYLNNAVFGQYNKAIAKLITRPDWDKEFLNISKIKDKEMQGRKLGQLLSRIGAVGLSSEKPYYSDLSTSINESILGQQI